MIQSPKLLKQLHVIGRRAASTFETLCNSYELADRCIKENIKGDFVECGIGKGSQVAVMALACKENNEHRTIWAIDSYKGIPLAGKHDTSQPGIGKITHNVNMPLRQRLENHSGIGTQALHYIKSYIRDYGLHKENIKYLEGWFQDTLPNNRIKDIALLRLDGDLYESTQVCLKYLYPKLVKGGYLIIDDYALTGCRKAVTDYGLTNFTPVIAGSGVVYMKK